MYKDTLNVSVRNKNTEVNAFTSIIVSFYFFLSFYDIYLNQIIGSYTRYFIILIIILLIFNNKKVDLRWYHLSFYLWFLLRLNSYFWSRDLTLMEAEFLSQIGMLLLFFIMTTAIYEKKFINTILNTMLYTSASMGVLGLFFSEPYNGNETRQVLTLFGADIDPNNLAALYLVAVTLSLINILHKRKNLLINLVIFFINTYMIAMTGSRGGMVSYILVLFSFAILSNKSKIKLNNTFFKVILFILIIALVYIIFRNYLPSDIFNRLFDFDEYSGGSNRDIIWKNTFDLFKQYPLFGAGWGSHYGYNGIYMAVHNTFLLVLTEVGMIGFVLFFAPILWGVIKSLKLKIPHSIIILISAFGPAFFVDALNKRLFNNIIIIFFILINYHSNIIKDKNDIKK